MPADAVSVLNNGQADMVAMTRAQIADAELTNKMREGRLDDIRRCIGCNQGCIDRLFLMTSATCVHNPAAGYELELGTLTLQITERPQRVVVVGAGPAGLKAAEVAARAGHQVTLIERRQHTGGQLRLAASVPGREEVAGVYTYLNTQIQKLGVDVRLGWAPTAEQIAAPSPDRVIVATGSAPGHDIIGNIARGVLHTPGLDQPHVLNVWDVLERSEPVGHRVLVADDGEGTWKAISIALDLSGRDHDVHLSSPLAYIGAKIGPFSQNRLIPRIFASTITTHSFASIAGIGARDVELTEMNKPVTVPDVDTVILAGWHRPVNDLYFALKELGVPVDRVGDAIASRSMLEAVHEGERVARSIDDKKVTAHV